MQFHQIQPTMQPHKLGCQKFWFEISLILKEISQAEPECMNIHPPINYILDLPLKQGNHEHVMRMLNSISSFGKTVLLAL